MEFCSFFGSLSGVYLSRLALMVGWFNKLASRCYAMPSVIGNIMIATANQAVTIQMLNFIKYRVRRKPHFFGDEVHKQAMEVAMKKFGEDRAKQRETKG